MERLSTRRRTLPQAERQIQKSLFVQIETRWRNIQRLLNDDKRMRGGVLVVEENFYRNFLFSGLFEGKRRMVISVEGVGRLGFSFPSFPWLGEGARGLPLGRAGEKTLATFLVEFGEPGFNQELLAIGEDGSNWCLHICSQPNDRRHWFFLESPRREDDQPSFSFFDRRRGAGTPPLLPLGSLSLPDGIKKYLQGRRIRPGWYLREGGEELVVGRGTLIFLLGLDVFVNCLGEEIYHRLRGASLSRRQLQELHQIFLRVEEILANRTS